jgi:hypothetical protein
MGDSVPGWSPKDSRSPVCTSSSAVRWAPCTVLWAEMYRSLMDGIVELSCQPIEISGRDRITRHVAAEAIHHDADWNNGNYDKNPSHYGQDRSRQRSPRASREMAPTRAAATDQLYDDRVAWIAKGDANDSLGDRSRTTAPSVTVFVLARGKATIARWRPSKGKKHGFSPLQPPTAARKSSGPFVPVARRLVKLMTKFPCKPVTPGRSPHRARAARHAVQAPPQTE